MSIFLARSFALVGNILTKDYAIPDGPYMPKRNVLHLAAAMGRADCYLEYGSGGSTVLAASQGVPDIISVESDAAWLLRVEEKLRRTPCAARLHLLLVDIGPTRALGYPRGDMRRSNFPDYALAPWRHCAETGLSPDLVLIDGRFRLACLLAALRHAKPECRILVDDYFWRRSYHRVEAILRPVAMIGRMAEFRVPGRLHHEQIDALFQATAHDTR